ncbi:venom serine protease-like [Sipha flava]|uniref:Venom serine protease-like n=1 Tax=Sipha flava TaxID=143950 RepID=A0A8B8FJP9_9HEMI|nr:venom serine protease-like [Sipha flava]
MTRARSPFPPLLPLLLLSKNLVWCSSPSDAVPDQNDPDDYYRADGGLCQFYQIVEPGNRSYYLYSPDYPSAYQADQRDWECRWFAKTPSPLDRLVLDCHEFDLPESSFCNSDALIVSRVGDENFADGVRHCGPKSFTAISRTNKMNIMFVAKRQSNGGSFMCSLGAKRMDYRIPETSKSSQFCECGEHYQDVVLNGNTAGVNEFPLMASLVNEQTAKLFCGAVIIGKHHVLTAAHCMTDVNPFQIILLVGDHDFINHGGNIDPSILMEISEIYIHPMYNSLSVAHDLAIVETFKGIPFSSKVGPACLPFKYVNNDFVGSTVNVLGWGSVRFDGSNSLKKSHMKVAPMSRCAGTSRNEIEHNQLCTYISKVNNCQVDSGGPLLWSDPATGRLNVIGVVSNRFVCAESTPSVHTRLATTANMNWIKVILMGKYYCR